MPHPVTFSRVLGEKVKLDELEEIISAYFKQYLSEELPPRSGLTLSIDGKTLRGTIVAGAKQGVHLMSAYLPQNGIVLNQLEVEAKTNEIMAAPRLLKMVGLRGIVVTGNAMQAQMDLLNLLALPEVSFPWDVCLSYDRSNQNLFGAAIVFKCIKDYSTVSKWCKVPVVALIKR